MLQTQLQLNRFAIAARIFFGAGIAVIGFQHFQFASFRPVISPPWPTWINDNPAAIYAAGIILITGGLAIAANFRTQLFSILIGSLLFAMFIFLHVPYLLFIGPHSAMHLGLWTDPLKESALAGGAFVIAGISYTKGQLNLINIGRTLFGLTMLLFGIDHFYYPDFVASLVPGWIPGKLFCAYAAGVLLIVFGACFILRLRPWLVGLLNAAMIFLWLIVLHIPRAVVAPASDKGNEVTSVFEALAFIGISLAIAIAAHRFGWKATVPVKYD